MAFCEARLEPELLRPFLPRLIPVLMKNMVFEQHDEDVQVRGPRGGLWMGGSGCGCGWEQGWGGGELCLEVMPERMLGSWVGKRWMRSRLAPRVCVPSCCLLLLLGAHPPEL